MGFKREILSRRNIYLVKVKTVRLRSTISTDFIISSSTPESLGCDYLLNGILQA